MALLDPIAPPDILPDVFARWFAARGWAPRAHQLELLKRAREDKSVLLIAPTGGGKTLAGFLPTLVELSEELRGGRGEGKTRFHRPQRSAARGASTRSTSRR